MYNDTNNQLIHANYLYSANSLCIITFYSIGIRFLDELSLIQVQSVDIRCFFFENSFQTDQLIVVV